LGGLFRSPRRKYVVFFDWEWGRRGGQTILKCFRPIYDENFDEEKILAFRRRAYYP